MQVVPQVGPGTRGRVAVCPGSYDPLTVGHLDIVTRATALFDVVIAAVVTNPAKATLFSVDERADLMRAALSGVPGVRVDVVPEGLLVDYAVSVGAAALVKGLRSGTDFAYEMPMALMNRHLATIETIFIPGDPRFEHISSSLVKEVARYGGDVAGLVPEPVLSALLARLAAG